MRPAQIIPTLVCALLINTVHAGTLDQLPAYPGWDETVLLTSKSNGQVALYEIIRKADNPKAPSEFLTINVYPVGIVKPEAGPGAVLTLMSLGVYSTVGWAKPAQPNMPTCQHPQHAKNPQNSNTCHDQPYYT